MIKSIQLLEKISLNFSLGLGARGLFILIKPGALWAAIQLDTEGGQRLAQVYLVGLLVLALTGTNAHRKFYESRFSQGENVSSLHTVAARYRVYLESLGKQILGVIVILVILSAFWPSAMLDYVFLGLVFGLAEKISDEGIRYTQFCLDNLQLMKWALTKATAVLAALLFAWVAGIDIGVSFPLLLLLAVCIKARRDLKVMRRAIAGSIKLGVNQFVQGIVRIYQRDIGQVAWVFTSIGLMSLDKWTLQTVNLNDLPEYMLVSQLASILIIAQSVFVLAPARVKLVNQDPSTIKVLQRTSLSLAGVSWLIGAVLYFYGVQAGNNSILYFPFLLVGMFVLTAPYLERLYWIARDVVRFGIDAGVIIFMGMVLLTAMWWTGEPPGMHSSLSVLVLILILRLVCIRIFVWQNHKQQNT
jgi:hypothetical protein